MCGARFFYFAILFFLTVFSLSGVSLLIQFIVDVRQGFTFSLPIVVNMWSVSALAYHQWQKRRAG